MLLGRLYLVSQEANVARGAYLGSIDQFYVAQVVVLEDGDFENVALPVKLDEQIISDPREDHDSACHQLYQVVDKVALKVAVRLISLFNRILQLSVKIRHADQNVNLKTTDIQKQKLAIV